MQDAVKDEALRNKDADFETLLYGFEGFKEGFDTTRLDELWSVFDKDGNGTLEVGESVDFLDILS